VDGPGHIRSLVQATAFGWTSCTLDFTFSASASGFSVSPLLASEAGHGVMAGIRL